MAETNTDRPRRPANLLRLSQEACKIDDVSSLEEAIALASEPGSRYSKNQIIERSLRWCVARRALKVLTYLLEQQGVDVSTVYSSTILALDHDDGDQIEPPYGVLDVLLAHGWDIDTRGPERTSFPLLWYATSDPKLLDWCLQHGASVYIPGDTPPRDSNGVGSAARMTVLEKAATDATVEAFEKLRTNSAPLGRRTLHRAVWHAAISAPKEEDDDKAPFEERLAMVRHLVDVVKLDANAKGGHAGMPTGTSLWSVACRNDGRNTRELIWLLLDRGADPHRAGEAVDAGGPPTSSPLVEAGWSRNTVFVEAVQEWEARQGECSK